jgi:hypothetical protein
MEPTGIFVGTLVDLSKKKTNVNIMQKYTLRASAPSKNRMGR